MRYPLGRLATILILAAVSLQAASWSDEVNRGNLLLEQGMYSQAVGEYQELSRFRDWDKFTTPNTGSATHWKRSGTLFWH
jgi:hypothetical protein